MSLIAVISRACGELHAQLQSHTITPATTTSHLLRPQTRFHRPKMERFETVRPAQTTKQLHRVAQKWKGDPSPKME